MLRKIIGIEQQKRIWIRTALVLFACLLTAQWAMAQSNACTVSITTTPTSPVIVGTPITVAASVSSGVGQLKLDGAVLCSSLPCSQPLNNLAQGIHTLGWNCTTSGGNNAGSQVLAVGQAFKQFLPQYYIYSLLYAAPGNQSQNGYTNSTTTGTTSGVTQSFASGTSISFSIDGTGRNSNSLFGINGGGSVGATQTDSHTDTFTELITSASGTAVASSQDPLSRYQDRFFLWLNPMVTVFQTGPEEGVFVVNLAQDTNGNILPPALIDVTVAELLNPAEIPLAKLQPSTLNGATLPGLSSLCAHPVACTLTNACGCVPSDFAAIVQQDPLVFDPNKPATDPGAQPPQVDSIRYVFKQTEKLQGPDCPPPTCPGTRNTFGVTDSTTIANSTTTTESYNVGVTEGLSLGAGPFTLRLTGTSSWTWSDSVTLGNSNGNSTAASVTFSTSTPQCTDSYNVYEDTRYHTFAFGPASPTPACLTPIPDFNLIANPPANLPITILNGGSATFSVASLAQLGFSGTETLSVPGRPAGMTAAFNPATFNLSPTNATGTSVLTITTTNNTTPAGNYALNVVGTSGSLSHSAPIAVIVQDFNLAVSPNSANVTANGSMTYTVTVTPLQGFNATVSLGISGLPQGVTGTFNPTSITGTGTSILTITTAGAIPGNSTFTVTGTAGTDSQTATASLSIVDFSISAAPSSQTLAQGGSKAAYTVTASALNGFGDPIVPAVNGLPNGVSATFNPAVINGAGTSVMTLTAAGSAQLGSTPLTISGSSRGVTHTAGVTLVVNPPPAIASVAPAQAPVGGFITVTGTNFNASQGNNTITIGGVVASPTSWSDTSIVVPVPLTLAGGSAPVIVSVDGSPSNSAGFSVTPGITSITPASGPVGSTITINGTNFGASQGTSTISIGGLPAQPVVSWSNTSVVVSVPSGLGLGNAPVVVTVGGLASNSFNFQVTPGITSLTPSSGPVGTSVTIAGTNFGSSQGTSTVTFGGTSVTPVSWSNSSIVVPAPGLAAGSVNVVVTVSGSASNAVTYTFTPGINSITPASGPVGTTITVSGSDFGATQGSSTITVGGQSVTPGSWSDTSIVLSVPSGLGVGSVPVVITVNGVNGTQNFTVTPGITSFSPASGPVGASITITGTNFGASQGSSTVTFAGITTIPTSWSATSIVAPVPSGVAAGNAGVVITVNGVPSPAANFSVAPGITGLSPASGPVGSALTITGTSFGAKQQTSTVTVGGITVTPSNWSNGSVTVPVPPSLGIGAAPVVVTVAGLASNSVNFNVTPGISSLSPSTGPVGTSVTVTGSNFGAAQGSSTITIAGTGVTPVSWSNTSIVFAVPGSLGLGAAGVVVTVGGVSSNTGAFTVTPGITSLSPASGPVGTSITINGTNFGASQGASTVSIGGSTVSPSSWSNTAIGIVIPNLPAGPASVIVTVNGLASNLATFSVTPVISNLSLISGPTGTAITITGTNFGSSQGASSVTFAGLTSTPTSWSSTSINVTVPAGLGPGSSPVIVTVNGAASNNSFFTVTPSITSLSPTSGVAGATVTITGTGFGAAQGSSTVSFNGVSATVSSWSNTTILTKVPSTAATGNVVVTVNGIPSNGTSFTVYTPSVFFPVAAASTTSGLLQLKSTSDTTPTNINSADLINQPSGEYLIQAFDTQAGVPNSTAVWQSGLSAVITVYMTQVAGSTGTLFPDVKLYLNSASGTPICSAVSSSALTTTQTLYTLSCAPNSNIALSSSDRFYLWVGVSSSSVSTISEKAQLTIGPPSRGRQAGSLTVPVR